MQATPQPSPFNPVEGFEVLCEGGLLPYEVTALPSPPNPQGVLVVSTATGAEVEVPSDLPPGTTIYLSASDSSIPPAVVNVENTTQ